jgi:hypothetical protein
VKSPHLPSLAAAFALTLLLVPSPAPLASDQGPVWTVGEEKNLRTVRFRVSDARCAYRIIAEPEFMSSHIPHVRGYEIHESRPGYMDLSITEIFVKMARGTSRYDRHFNGANHVRWTLTEGRQRLHDGDWLVTPDKSGAVVVFSNRIEAKSRFHQRLIVWVQKVTMREIVKATRKHCGTG